MTRAPRRGHHGGFTLLEMMIAMSILALALTWMIEATTRAIVAENHAKLMTTSTFLARAKLTELEDKMAEKGFTDEGFSSEQCDEGGDEAFKRFKCCYKTEKVQMPGVDVLQTAMGGLGGGAGGGQGGGSSPGGFNSTPSGGNQSQNIITSQMGLMKEIFEQGVKTAKVTCTWTESGVEQKIMVSEVLTDPKRVDQSAGAVGALLNGGMPGMGGPGGVANPPPGGAPPSGAMTK